jgi:hypothetical protein
VPAVVIGTDEFQALGALECTARGMPALRFANTGHPLGGLRPAMVVDKAHAMAEATARAVLAAGAALPAAGSD